MSRTKKKSLTKCEGKSHGLRKELILAGIVLPCSWRRNCMMPHRDDLKELKIIRKLQGKKRRQYLKRGQDNE